MYIQKVIYNLHSKLNKSPYEIRDYNKKCAQLVGQCTVHVQCSSKGEFPILIAKEQRENILGVKWFQPVGIGLTGLHKVNAATLWHCEKICKCFRCFVKLDFSKNLFTTDCKWRECTGWDHCNT